MVVQRGTLPWVTVQSNSQSQQQQHHFQQPLHVIKHDLDYDPSIARATSVVTDSPSVRCNVVVPSSTDSQTMVEWKNTFNMRQVTLSNLAMRPSCRPNLPISRVRGRCITSTSRSLDILRQNIQVAINKEIDAVIKKYLEKFFQPAIDNIRNNLGPSSVTEDHVRDVCRQILEEAKQMYCCTSQSRSSSPYNELSDSETGSINEYRFGRPSARSPLFRKRKESDTDSETSQSARRKKSKPAVPGGFPSGRSTPIKPVKVDTTRRDGHKWDPNRIFKETLFVMGARANKVLGFGQTRGRLYIKHPGLLRYSGDQEDKEWLSRHNLMPPSGGKAYLMILDDILELAEMDEYRNNPNVLLHELKGFEAPEFMLKKIRAFISHMRTDGPEKKPGFGEPCEANFAMMQGRLGLGDCVSSAMTPPATVLDSGPPTPSDALELLECPSVPTLGSQHSDTSQYLRLHDASPSPHNSLMMTPQGLGSYSQADAISLCHSVANAICGSHTTLSALLAGHLTSDNSQEGVD